MQNKNKSIKASFSKILLAVMTILLFTAPTIQAITYDGGATYEVTGTINENVFIEDDGTIVNFNANVPYPNSVYVYSGATLNFDDNANAYYIDAYLGSYVNLYDGTVGWAISVFTGANVRVYGASFTVAGDPATHYPGETLSIDAVLTAYDTGGGELFTGRISCLSGASISLKALGGGAPIEVDIDIKPGSYPNSINLGSNGVVPVAILSTADFNATTIPANTVFLAGAGVAVRGKGNNTLAHEEDVNGDGLMDLVVKVETENLEPGTFQDGGAVLQIHESPDPESAVLYEGLDEITIVPPE